MDDGAPCTAQAVDVAVGERCDGPLFVGANERRIARLPGALAGQHCPPTTGGLGQPAGAVRRRWGVVERGPSGRMARAQIRAQ